jgi:AraC-like DNA-binding protein
MSIIHEERLSDSPFVETITYGRTAGDGSTIRPATCHWHMVFTKYNGRLFPFIVGPLTAAGSVSWTEGAEILWIKFKLGTFMPRLPTRDILDKETILPGAGDKSFWLNGSAWQFPDFENVDTFINRLARNEMLACDPVVKTLLQGHSQEISPRTVRHRFLRTTGLTQGHIHQYERAQRAAALLQQGKSILDTVYEGDYFDQPHLTRSLKRFLGKTPAQLVRSIMPG